MSNPSGRNTSSNSGFAGFTQPQDQMVYGERKQMGALQAAAPTVPTPQPDPFALPQQAKQQPSSPAPQKPVTSQSATTVVPTPSPGVQPDPFAMVWQQVAQTPGASQLVQAYGALT